jgi:hypothetical protein
MQHAFDISIAEKFGVNVAIFLNNLAFWIAKNKSNNKHFYEGRYWTYNSQDALTKLFTYWSRQNIRTMLKACQDHHLIMTSNFNPIGYDRTTWYAFTNLGLSLFPNLNFDQNAIGENQPIDCVKPTESLVRTNQPIPDINTDNKTQIKNYCASDESRSKNDQVDFEEFRKVYPNKKNMAKAKKQWSKIKQSDQVVILAKLKEQIAKDPQYQGDPQFVPHPTTYLNGRRWEDELPSSQPRTTTNQATPLRPEPKCVIKEWAPGNPDYDRVNGHGGSRNDTRGTAINITR